MTRVTVRNLPTVLLETPAEERFRQLFWARHEWHQAIGRYKRAQADAAQWRAKIKKLEAKR